VSSAYKTKPDAFGLPFLSLPNEINLGDASMEDTCKKATVSLNGKDVTSRAAGLLRRFNRFLAWLKGPEAREILSRYHYDGPGDAKALAP
jgi:hypothetical protein